MCAIETLTPLQTTGAALNEFLYCQIIQSNITYIEYIQPIKLFAF